MEWNINSVKSLPLHGLRDVGTLFSKVKDMSFVYVVLSTIRNICYIWMDI